MTSLGGGEALRPILAGGEKLRFDVEQGGGGGEKFHPSSFADAKALLLPQVQLLRDSVRQLPALFRGPKVVVQATLAPNYYSASDYPDVLVRSCGLIHLGSREARAEYRTASRILSNQPAKTFYFGVAQPELRQLEAILSQDFVDEHHPGPWEDLRKIIDLSLPPDEAVLAEAVTPLEDETGEISTWEAVLHPMVGADGTRFGGEVEVLDKLHRLVADEGGEVADGYIRRVGDLTYLPVALTRTAARRLSAFNPMRCLRPMPRLRRVSVRKAAPPTPPAQPPKAARPRSNTVVACFDGGIDPTCPIVQPFVRSVDLTPEPPQAEMVEHGSVVTNALLFGYPDGQDLRQPDVRVDHFRVLPVPPSERFDHDMYWLLDQICHQVRHARYRIAVICVAPELPMLDGDTPHYWTAQLDALTVECGTLFVIAAGNGGESGPDLGRIQIPGDMANGLTIGACTSRRLDKPLERAPYSCVGPGRPGCHIQPLGLAFGGTDDEMFIGLGPNGARIETVGTSFAAPLAAHGLAGLLTDVGDDFASAGLLRTFAIHHAERRSTKHDPNQHGYGRILDRYDNSLAVSPNEVTVVYKDLIERGESVALPLPLPDGLPPDIPLSLWCTAGFVSRVAPTDPVDYTLSGLDVVFRPHAETFAFNPPKGSGEEPVILNELVDVARAEDLVGRGYKRSQRPVSVDKRSMKTEIKLREGGKWETLLQIRRPRTLAGALLEPVLDLAYLERRSGELVDRVAALGLPYTVLVTIRAPKGVNLYDLVRQQYPVLTPLQLEIRARV